MLQKNKKYVIRVYNGGAIASIQKLAAKQSPEDLPSNLSTIHHQWITISFLGIVQIDWSKTEITKQRITSLLLWLADAKNMRWLTAQLHKKHITNVSYEDIKTALLA